MSRPEVKRKVRCAVYTRKSSEEGLELAFNSLDAQHEACAAYIDSQCHEGWLRAATPTSCCAATPHGDAPCVVLTRNIADLDLQQLVPDGRAPFYRV